jgi:hypothetical protein
LVQVPHSNSSYMCWLFNTSFTELVLTLTTHAIIVFFMLDGLSTESWLK